MMPGPDRVVSCPHCAAPARWPTLLSDTIRHPGWTDGDPPRGRAREIPEVARCVACRGYYWVADARVIGEITFDEEREGKPVPAEWVKAPRIQRALTPAEFEGALAAGLGGTRDREIRLRLMYLWAMNRPLKNLFDLGCTVGCLGVLFTGLLGLLSAVAGAVGLRTLWLTVPSACLLAFPIVLAIAEGLAGYRRARVAVGTPGGTYEANALRLHELLAEDDAWERLLKVEMARQVGRFDEAERLLDWSWPADGLARVRRMRELVAARDRRVREAVRR